MWTELACFKTADPKWRDRSFLTTNSAWVSGTDLIDMGEMKYWVDPEADSENCESPKI